MLKKSRLTVCEMLQAFGLFWVDSAESIGFLNSEHGWSVCKLKGAFGVHENKR